MKFLYMDQVLTMTGLPRSTFYTRRRLGQFPAPVRLGLRSIAWKASDVEAWRRDRNRGQQKLKPKQ